MSEKKNNTNFESVAIVTITFNSSHVIEQFIYSLNKSEFINFKLFFIDNYSTDNTIKLIEKKANFDFEIIKNKTNKGVAINLTTYSGTSNETLTCDIAPKL